MGRSDRKSKSGNEGKMKIVFYTTDGCSLCEQMLDRLIGEPAFAGVQLQTCEIAFDDELLDRYGATLPVLRVGDLELHSPFSSQEAADWLVESIQVG